METNLNRHFSEEQMYDKYIKIFNIFSHQANAHQSYIVIPSHPS